MRSLAGLLAVVFLLLGLVGDVQGQVIEPEAALESMGSWMQKYQVPGVIVAYADASGDQWLRTFGYADYARRDFAREETMVPLGSVTEWFSSAILLQLWQEQGVPWDRSLEDFVDRSFGDNTGAVPTLEQLLQHRSGIDTVSFLLPPEETWTDAIADHWNGYVSPQAIGQLARSSRLNYALAGAAAEALAGDSWSAIVEESGIFPMGLQYASRMPDAESRWIPHRRRELGYLPESSWPTALLPAVGGYAQASDLPGLFRSSVAHAVLQIVRDQPTLGGLFPLHHPSLDVYGRVEQMPGLASGLWYIPQDQAVLFATANSEYGALLLRDFFGSVITPPLVTSELPDDAMIRALTGTYLTMAVPENGVEKIGPLLGNTVPIVLTAGKEHPLTFRWGPYEEEMGWVSDDRFVGVDSGAILKVSRDSQGRVQFLTHDGAPQDTFRALSWYENLTFRRTLWGILLFILILEVFSPWLFPARRRRRPDPREYVWVRRVNGWLFGIAFLVAAAALLNADISQLVFGLPAGLVFARVLLWPAFLAVLVFLGVLVHTWIRVSLPVGRKAGYTIVWLYYAVLAWFCVMYHMLPV